MEKYQDFTVQDWIWDDAFRAWVLTPTTETNEIWHKWLRQNPDKWANVREAIATIKALNADEPLLTESEMSDFMKQMAAKLEGATTTHSPFLDVAPSERIRPFYRNRALQIAAVLVVLIFASPFFMRKISTNTEGVSPKTDVTQKAVSEGFIETFNNADTPQVITLSDGSVVTLKKDSKLRYTSPFKGQNRVVYLSGEAIFDVAKIRQFHFSLRKWAVDKVLGTSFVVKAHKIEQQVTVEVRTGKVSVFNQKDLTEGNEKTTLEPRGLVLTPNQKIVFDKQIDRMTKTLVAAPTMVLEPKELEKLNFNFDDTPANIVFETLRKAYSINIIYDESVLKNCPVTAPLNEGTLFEKLDIICKAIEARFDVLDGQIVIQSKGC
ncbi:MAG: FecR family protein [Saprospiraceae bacterium]|nr:FecR family protein [Saprospiraceae bacterium]